MGKAPTSTPATPRKKKERSETAKLLIEEAKQTLREANKLAKIIDTINELNAWAVGKVEAAVAARKEKLSAE